MYFTTVISTVVLHVLKTVAKKNHFWVDVTNMKTKGVMILIVPFICLLKLCSAVPWITDQD